MTKKLENEKQGICLSSGIRAIRVMFLKLDVYQIVYLFQILRGICFLLIV